MREYLVETYDETDILIVNSQMNEFARSGYRLHSLTSYTQNGWLLVMERDLPS